MALINLDLTVQNLTAVIVGAETTSVKVARVVKAAKVV